MTVARLRQLLGGEARVEVAEGRVRLAPEAVWSDVHAASAALAALQAARDARMRGDAAPADAADLRQRLLAVYRGPFLPDEDDPPALLAARAQLTQAFRAALLLEAQDESDETQRQLVLERALAVEPTAEGLARALMQAHLQRGAHAEALGVYQRCRAALAQHMGLKPSAATEALRERIVAAASVGERAA
jgi:DNA-binding SARP family transcriptional activator